MRRTLLLPLLLLACSAEAPPKLGASPPEEPIGRPLSEPASPKGEAAKKKDAPYHKVFSLIDNRHLAHIERKGAPIVLAGHPGFAKYLHFGKPKLSWKLNQTFDGKKVALADATATLEILLTEEQAREAKSLWVRLHSSAARRLTVKAGGKSATAEIAAGWQTAEIPLPAGLLAAGENTLQLSFSKGERVAVEWIQVGGAPEKTDPPRFSPEDGAFLLPEESRLTYYVRIPEEGRFVGALDGEGNCRLAIRAEAHSGASVEGTLSTREKALDLSALSGQIARLSLKSEGCPELRLTEAALTMPGEAPVVSRGKKPKYVILWIMDSLRADRVKPFFPTARPEVPYFEELTQKATFFRSNYVQGNESRASHASIWTSLYPVNHRMINGSAKLPDSLITLDEVMKSAGFYNSGVSANGYIISRWGFGTKWDFYRNHIHDGGGLRGEDLLKVALQSVEKRKEKPFFLYIGTIDTHVSWRPKEPWFSKYDEPGPYKGPFTKVASGNDIGLIAAGKLKVNERDIKRAIAMYDSNVSYQDALLKKLFETLEEWGILEETMVVVTADHGDEQWEDKRVGHGASLRDSLVHVPLLIYYPPLFPAGLVEEGVDTVDILPTLLDALGQKIPEEFQGESLIPLAQGLGRGYPRPSFASMYEDAHVMRLAGWKMRASKSGVLSLFDLANDPEEKKDLLTSRPIERRMLTDVFSTFLVYQKEWKKSRWGVASNVTPQFSADLEG